MIMIEISYNQHLHTERSLALQKTEKTNERLNEQIRYYSVKHSQELMEGRTENGGTHRSPVNKYPTCHAIYIVGGAISNVRERFSVHILDDANVV